MLPKRKKNKEERAFYFDNHIIVIIYSILVFVIVNIMLILVFLYNYKHNMEHEIEKNIYEYEEADLSHICGLYECIYIKNYNTLYRNINHNSRQYSRLVKSYDNVEKKYVIFENLSITSNMDVLVEVAVDKYLDGFVVVSRNNIFDIINNAYFYMLTVFMTFNIMLLIYNLLSYNKYQFKHNVMLQHEGYYKSMMMLTENIHHELNTPLIVIYKKIQKIKQRCINTETCDADFDLIDTSLEGIADLLVRMRPFKDLKKSTSRDLRTLIKTTCDIMNISQHEVFDYEIEYDFMNYKLDTSLLTPGEFTAMMLNFIKNSIDANAHDMKFKIKWVKNESISFYIIDNGNGIPLNVQDSIFKQDSSSKSRNRGNGLYINKFIANESNGDINLKYSDSTGTVFEVVIPIIQNKGKDEK